MRKYDLLKERMRKIADVNYASAVLSWDQETYMPPNGADSRSSQLSTLSGIAHELFTSPETESLLHQAKDENGLNVGELKNLQLIDEEITKQKKYSTSFVEEMSKTISICFQAWNEARRKNDYSIFSGPLEKLIEFKFRETEILGYESNPYDALLDQYEKKLTVKDLDELFDSMKEKLSPLLKRIFSAQQVDDSFFFQKYDKTKQWDFGIDLLKQMGYDFESGRQDISTHPFTINFSSKDVRVTTRIDENNLSEMIWSCIHEGGHALYEQGLPVEEYGMPLSEAVSLGINESQSRLWENNVGRSLEYWKNNFKKLQALFPEQLKNVDAEQFYKASNKVEPSFIRTNADELTYHFHIMIRYEIERNLFSGNISVKDLPSVWNELYEKHLGLKVKNDKEGILQDVHWSHGSFGYFPTYSIGSFYAAQFFNSAQKDIPNLKDIIEKGDMSDLLKWLRNAVHVHGKFYSAQDLCIRITGEKLNVKYFMDYVTDKYEKIYNL
ncbi:MAG: carboxypeptidase M32 [Bacteroidota bacterium]